MPRHGRHDLQGALKGGQGGEGGGGAEPALRAGTSRAVGLQLQSGRYVGGKRSGGLTGARTRGNGAGLTYSLT